MGSIGHDFLFIQRNTLDVGAFLTYGATDVDRFCEIFERLSLVYESRRHLHSSFAQFSLLTYVCYTVGDIFVF